MTERNHAIVCTIDFSPFSALVAAHGIALARRAGARLYLVHAVHHPQDGVHPTALFERGGDLAHHTDEANQRLSDLMAASDVHWDPVIRFGDPVEQTVAAVKQLPACLVISASHGVSGFRRFFIGTVVERLARALTCPMLVVKPDAQGADASAGNFMSAVVTCDRRGHWKQLAPLLSLLQPDQSSRLHLVHAMEAPLVNTEGKDNGVSYDQMQHAHQGRLSRRLNEQASLLFGHAGQVAVTVEPGVPQEMVLAIARSDQADVITVGARPTGKMGRWIAGSTTETLLRHSPCSVLTVPESVKGRRKPRGHR